MKKFIVLIIVLIAVIAGGSIAYKTMTAKSSGEGAEAASEEAADREDTKPESDNEVDAEGRPDADEEAEDVFYAPDFSVYDESGTPVALSDLKGKPVVINFWATWCGYCIEEMPEYEEVYKEYGDKVEFMMIDITDGQRDTVESAKEFIEEAGYTFPVYYDVDLDATATYGARSIPMSVFIDKDGVINSVYTGALSGTQIEESVKAVL